MKTSCDSDVTLCVCNPLHLTSRIQEFAYGRNVPGKKREKKGGKTHRGTRIKGGPTVDPRGGKGVGGKGAGYIGLGHGKLVRS